MNHLDADAWLSQLSISETGLQDIARNVSMLTRDALSGALDRYGSRQFDGWPVGTIERLLRNTAELVGYMISLRDSFESRRRFGIQEKFPPDVASEVLDRAAVTRTVMAFSNLVNNCCSSGIALDQVNAFAFAAWTVGASPSKFNGRYSHEIMAVITETLLRGSSAAHPALLGVLEEVGERTSFRIAVASVLERYVERRDIRRDDCEYARSILRELS